MGGGEPLDVADGDRLVSQEEQGPTGRTPDGEYKIILPGLRRVIQAKTAGQREYLQAIAQHDIVIGIGPAGTGKTYLAVAMAVDALARKRVRRDRKSTRLNSSHSQISYAVFCLKKKKTNTIAIERAELNI